MTKKIILLTLLVITIISGVVLEMLPIHIHDGLDKVCHFMAFAIFSGLLTLCYVEFFGAKLINRFLVYLLIIGGVVACFSELLQNFRSIERDCCALDWLFDILAIGFVGMITYLYYSQKEKIEVRDDFEFSKQDLETTRTD